MTSRERVN